MWSRSTCISLEDFPNNGNENGQNVFIQMGRGTRCSG